jgi:hypothetical protein
MYIWGNPIDIREIHTWDGQAIYLKEWLLNSLNNVLLIINLLIFTYICLEIAKNS